MLQTVVVSSRGDVKGIQGVIHGNRCKGSSSTTSISTKGFHTSQQRLPTAGSMPSEAESGHLAAHRSVAACLWGDHNLAISGLA